MPSLVIKATTQAVLLGALSNVLAQMLNSSPAKNDNPSFDFSSFIFFTFWNLISCPPNVVWQVYLETSFPSAKPDKPGDATLNKTNLIKKLLLDQSVSAFFNNAGYLAAVSAWKGRNMKEVLVDVNEDFWPLMVSGWQVWPVVSLLSFTVVPLQHRTLFWGVAGLFWNVYLIIIAS